MSTRRIPPAGDPFYAAGKKHTEALAGREDREVRECRSCYGSGSVLEDASYDAQTGELVQTICVCPICFGRGEVSVYLYGRS